MSLAEVKASVAGMSVDERLEVAAFIAHLNRAEDRGYQAELARRMSAMDSGRKTGATALKKLHDGLAAQPNDWREILDGERPVASDQAFEQCLKPE